ncbi:MAG: ABC transporter ATP-binding protein, partial [Clostridia bacterium]|nr:ABC transporter ATP-binding protein [Clostridia bacterium]
MKKKKESFFLIFARYYKSHMPMFSLDLACAVLMSVIDLAFPLVSKYALQSLLPEQEYGVFFIVIGSVLLAYILRTVMVYIVTYLGHQLGVRIEASMRRDLFAHLQKLPFSFYDKSRTGYLMSRCTSDLFEITELAHHGPEDIFIAGITLIGACIIMLTIEWRLALVLIVSIPLILLFVMSQRRRMGRTSRQVKERTAQINAGIESSISGAKVAKAFTNEEYEVEKFDVGNERFVASKKGFYQSMGSFTAGMEFYTALLNVLVLGVGGLLIMKGKMDLVVLVTFTLYVSTFVSPIKRLTTFSEMFAQGMAGFSRFRELMNTEPDIKDLPGAEDIHDVRGEI